MDYKDVAYLISVTTSKDEIGNIVETQTEKKIFAKSNSVGTKEFYEATAVGLTPSVELQIRESNYNGETLVKLNNKVYSVIRTTQKYKKREDIVLVLSEKSGTL